MAPDAETLLDRQQAFGYHPGRHQVPADARWSVTGQEAIGSMGADNPPAVLSNRPKHLSNYFKQNFAQVTNPPIDPIREELVMSLVSLIGPRPNLLGLHSGGEHMRLEVSQPVLTNEDLERIRNIEDTSGGAFRTKTLPITYPAADGAEGMERGARMRLCRAAEQAVRKGYNILILSDRKVDADHVAIPALLATSAVHHHLIRHGLRTESGLVVETGAALEVHHFATLAGYGAEAINPYLAFETIQAALHDLPDEISYRRRPDALHQGGRQGPVQGHVQDGHLHLSVLLRRADLRRHRSGHGRSSTSTSPAPRPPIEGIGLNEVAEEAVRWHRDAFGDAEIYRRPPGRRRRLRLPPARRGAHLDARDDPEAAACGADQRRIDLSREFAQAINDQSERLLTLRGLFEFKFADRADPAGRGRAGQGDRQALRHRRDVVRLDLERGALARWPSP